MSVNDTLIAEIAAREAIRDCLFRYARAIDRCDAAALVNVYWPEARDDHGIFNGDRDAFIAWAIPALKEMEQTAHSMSNILIEFKGDGARVETYFTAYHRTRATEDRAAAEIFVGGRYLDLFSERGGEWRILDRSVVYDWFQELAFAGDWQKGVLGLSFQENRWPNDRVFNRD